MACWDWSRDPAEHVAFLPEQEQDLRDHLHGSPSQYQQNASRWSLVLIQKIVNWLNRYSVSGIWRLMRALNIHYKQGQQHMHSPDPNYLLKAAEIQSCVQSARDQPEEVITLFLDEFTFHRWAETAPVYSNAGRIQPKVVLPCQFNTAGRIVSVINVVSGQVLYRVRSHITVTVLAELLLVIRMMYPNAKTIFVIQDNWHNVHFHPRQIAAAHEAHITLVALPTYSPWLNPIEKLWRKLKQEVLLMHTDGLDWDRIKSRVTLFLDQFASGSQDLVKYVGLLPS